MTTPDDDTRLVAQRAHLRRLANESFPEAARRGAYPVRLNHCFLRIVYDAIFAAQWDTVLPKGRVPVVDRLTPKQLTKAIDIAEAVLADPRLCATLNARSLAYRGRGMR